MKHETYVYGSLHVSYKENDILQVEFRNSPVKSDRKFLMTGSFL